MERLRSGQYCSVECKTDARQQVDQLAVESLTLFGPRTRVVKEEKPHVPKAAETPVEPPDPGWGEVVGQDSPGCHDAPIRALGFPAWVAPPAAQRKKTIEEYRPVSRVPDDVMMEQEFLLASAAMWVSYPGTNPESADGFQSDYRFPLIVPAVGLAKPRRSLAEGAKTEIETHAAREAETAAWVGFLGEMEAAGCAVHPRLNASPVPPEISRVTETAPILEAPPPPPAPTRPKVDAHRIASSFPAMMQAGLVRVEPGFATAVLELRAIDAPAAKRCDPGIAGSEAKPFLPPAATRLPVEMRGAAPTALGLSVRGAELSLRSVETAAEQVDLPATIPPLAAGRVAAMRARPEIRVKLRYLPMPHFQLPGPAADWSH